MKNNNAFRIIELNQARNKIIINGYEDLSEEEWHELAHLSFAYASAQATYPTSSSGGLLTPHLFVSAGHTCRLPVSSLDALSAVYERLHWPYIR